MLDVGRWRLDVGRSLEVGRWTFSHARTTLMLCIETMNPPLTPPRRGTVEFWTVPLRSAELHSISICPIVEGRANLSSSSSSSFSSSEIGQSRTRTRRRTMTIGLRLRCAVPYRGFVILKTCVTTHRSSHANHLLEFGVYAGDTSLSIPAETLAMMRKHLLSSPSKLLLASSEVLYCAWV